MNRNLTIEGLTELNGFLLSDKMYPLSSKWFNSFLLLLTHNSPLKPTGSDLEEKVAETQRIGNETQRMLKIGKKWLKNLYNAHLEENHDFKEKDAEEKDGDWNSWDD